MLEHYIAKFGYVAIFLGTGLEGEVFVLLGGFFAHREYLSLYPVVGAGALGAFAADLFYYSMGRRFGRALFERRPHLAKRIPRLERLMQRYHIAWLFGVRYLWGVRWASAALAGSLRLSSVRYGAIDFAACLLWAGVMVMLGYTTGEAVERMLGDVARYETMLLAVVAIAAALVPMVHYAKRARSQRRARALPLHDRHDSCIFYQEDLQKRRCDVEPLAEYEQAIKDAVAAGCMDRNSEGACAPPEGRTCALELNLRDIVTAVKAVKSERMDEYADSIREHVCMHCINQDEHGDCRYRDHFDCCLDNFMLLVVEAIESVDARHSAVK